MTTPTTWARWLRDRLADHEWAAADLVRHSDNRIGSGELSRWLTGKVTPKIDSIRVVCDVIGVAPVEGMIAAGHLVPDDVGTTVISRPRHLDELASLELLDELRRREESRQHTVTADATQPNGVVQGRRHRELGQEGESWAARRPNRDEPNP